MNVYPAKINRTVHYRTTIAGRMCWRPAVITAVTSDDVADLRVGHHGETYLGATRRSGDRGALNVNWNDRWRPG